MRSFFQLALILSVSVLFACNTAGSDQKTIVQVSELGSNRRVTLGDDAQIQKAKSLFSQAYFVTVKTQPTFTHTISIGDSEAWLVALGGISQKKSEPGRFYKVDSKILKSLLAAQ